MLAEEETSSTGVSTCCPPYSDEAKDERESGVRQWQEDVWKAIITSLRSPNPLEVRLDWCAELSRPAVSQYSAATPDRLDWFKDYNKGKAYAQKVKPFNFLLEFYAKRPDEMARDHLLISTDRIHEQPKPISPYSRDPYRMLPKIRDRVSGEPVEQKWLPSISRNQISHAEATDSGPTQRRHILVETIEDIGKEADR